MPQRETTTRRPAEIPDRLYFRIGDVAKICDVEPYVLRFWETEFPQLKPGKSGTGQRLYRRREVEFALRIKTLLHDQGYTIAGARLALKSDKETASQQPDLPFARSRADRQRLDKLRNEMKSLVALLSSEGKPPLRQPAARSVRPANARTVSKMPSPELF